MRAENLILGQGLAGTLLGWEFERAGLSFDIADVGHATAATSVAAGIVSPVTGRRLVKSWQIEMMLPMARTTYRELEIALGIPLWREMRIRRVFADGRTEAGWREKIVRGELAPFVESIDASGCWIRDAARVDLVGLLSAARERWRKAGMLRTEAVDRRAEAENYDLVIDCTGKVAAEVPTFDFVPWEFSKGELLELAVDDLPLDVVLNDGRWILPIDPGVAWVGATHQPGVRDTLPSTAGRISLEASARGLLGPDRPFRVTGQRAGVRVNLPDKHPVAGRHPEHQRWGIVNGLGAKGALWAPMLARQWVNHLTAGTPFGAEVEVKRFLNLQQR